MLRIIDLQLTPPLPFKPWVMARHESAVHYPQVNKNKRDNYDFDLLAKSVCQTSCLDFKHISDTQYH